MVRLTHGLLCVGVFVTLVASVAVDTSSISEGVLDAMSVDVVVVLLASCCFSATSFACLLLLFVTSSTSEPCSLILQLLTSSTCRFEQLGRSVLSFKVSAAPPQQTGASVLPTTTCFEMPLPLSLRWSRLAQLPPSS